MGAPRVSAYSDRFEVQSELPSRPTFAAAVGTGRRAGGDQRALSPSSLSSLSRLNLAAPKP